MTKEEALQKIEELKRYVANLDEEPQLQHGDVVSCDGDKRIIISADYLSRANSSYPFYPFFAIDKDGYVAGRWDVVSYKSVPYTKIRNIFED